MFVCISKERKRANISGISLQFRSHAVINSMISLLYKTFGRRRISTTKKKEYIYIEEGIISSTFLFFVWLVEEVPYLYRNNRRLTTTKQQQKNHFFKKYERITERPLYTKVNAIFKSFSSFFCFVFVFVLLLPPSFLLFIRCIIVMIRVIIGEVLIS